MVSSVELLLDDAADAAVRRQWGALAGAGLPSLARHTGATNRPHVTLVVSTEPWPDSVERALAAAAAGVALPLDVRLGGLVVFAHGVRHVLARLVVPSAALLTLQATTAEALREGGGPAGVPLTEPGRWTPHVTLARGLRREQFPAALAALAALGDGDLVAAGTALRRWDGTARREWLIAPVPPGPPGSGTAGTAPDG